MAQAGAPEGWYTEGEAAVGGQVFIKKPGDTPSNSAAKFNEYGDNTEPLFLNSLNFGLIKKDGSFRVDLHGANIGDDQKLEAVFERSCGVLYQPSVRYCDPGLLDVGLELLIVVADIGAVHVDAKASVLLDQAEVQRFQKQRLGVVAVFIELGGAVGRRVAGLLDEHLAADRGLALRVPAVGSAGLRQLRESVCDGEAAQADGGAQRDAEQSSLC